MVFGWFFIRPCPYLEHIPRTNTESDDQGGPSSTSSTPNEISPLITKDAHKQPPNVAGLAMMSTVDFWVLFWIMSLRECPRYEDKGC